jgi:hypothetical protein
MTEESYWANVERGITGPHVGTCILASLDRISLRHGIQPGTYTAYSEMTDTYEEQVGYGTNYVPPDFVARVREMENRAFAELGVPNPRAVRWTSARSTAELEAVLTRLASGGFRVAVLSSSHAVGLIRLQPSLYEVRSNRPTLQNAKSGVSVQKIFEFMGKPDRIRRRPHSSRKTDLEPNIVALPPEPRQRNRGR